LLLKTDTFPQETTWTLFNQCTNQYQEQSDSYQSQETEHVEEYCIPFGEYEFTIEDAWGDGICCGHGEGFYTLEYNGVEIKSGGSFGPSESTTFGSCSSSGPPTQSPVLSPITESPVATPTGPWEIIATDNLEDGTSSDGLFVNAKLNFQYKSEGGSSARIRKESQLKTGWITTTNYSELKVEFDFFTQNLEDNEYFALEYKIGSNWATANTWKIGNDFVETEDFTNVESNAIAVAGAAKLKLRFKAYNNELNDWIFIDKVIVRGKRI